MDLFQAVTIPTFVLHGINPSPPGVTVHVWMLLQSMLPAENVVYRVAHKNGTTYFPQYVDAISGISV